MDWWPRRDGIAADRELRIANRELRTANCELPEMSVSVQISRQNQLQRQPVGGVGEAESDPGLDIHVLCRFVDHTIELMRLFAGRVKSLEGTEVCVLFRRERPAGFVVVRDSHGR